MFHPHHLLQRRLGRTLSGAALAVALSMASPTGAQAAGTNPGGVWRWLEGLLADRIGAVTRNWTPPSPATSRSPVIRAKDLVCPPTGCPTTPGTAQGPATDPDGRTH
ncbi:MAG TPA: hypothetical protein VGS07_02275 [Thermoanaerobaculia bacterium]|nr:hypothetical protein [Thermoanaerobaculia bacterium]